MVWALASMLALGMVFGAASDARAHGRPPRLDRIAFDPSDPDHIVLGATFGLIVTRDAGASWHWSCAAAYGADPTIEDPDVLLTADGALVLSTFDGVVRGEPGHCEYGLSGGVARDAFVIDLASDPRDPATLWGLVSSAVERDQVIRSTDAGRTWRFVGEPLDPILTERILVAPSDPATLYVSGAIPPAGDVRRQAFLLRSVDGGERFTSTELELLEGERFPHVVGVDPTNAERVFVRIVRAPGAVEPERLLYSDDGGLTFTTLLELPSMRAFALSDDGRTAWAGSSEGLWIARDGGTRFEQVNALDVQVLASRGDALFVGADQRTAGFAFGRSTDGGATVNPLLRLQDAQALVECARCSGAGITCPAWLPDLRADLEIYLGAGDVPQTGLPRDAGIPAECRGDGGTALEPPAGGCDCSISARRASAPAWLTLALLALLKVRRRGRRSAGR